MDLVILRGPAELIVNKLSSLELLYTDRSSIDSGQDSQLSVVRRSVPLLRHVLKTPAFLLLSLWPDNFENLP